MEARSRIETTTEAMVTVAIITTGTVITGSTVIVTITIITVTTGRAHATDITRRQCMHPIRITDLRPTATIALAIRTA